MSSLKQRWFTDAGRELMQAVVRRLRDRQSLDGLGLGSVDGRIDLRHVPLPASLRHLDGVVLRGLDFSGASAANLRLRGSEITDCRFDSADCQYWLPHSTLVTDTSFARADLRYANLGAWQEGRGNHYRRVSFRSARMRGVSTSAATYEDCDFSFAALNRVNFWQSTLIRCTFAGPVREVVFDGRLLGEGKPDANPMLDVDLTAAVLDGCDFRGVNIDAVRLPDDPQLLIIRDRSRVDRAIAALDGAGSDVVTGIAVVMLHHVRQALDRDGLSVLNLRDTGAAADFLGGVLGDEG